MEDTAHANALARREVIQEEIKRHKERIDALRRESKRINEWLSGYSRYRDTPPDVLLDPRSRPANPAKEIVTEHVQRLIEKRGEPMLRREITTGLENEGITLEGSNPDMVLSTMLWRMKSKIVHIKKFGYWLADRDYEPAGYKAAASAA